MGWPQISSKPPLSASNHLEFWLELAGLYESKRPEKRVLFFFGNPHHSESLIRENYLSFLRRSPEVYLCVTGENGVSRWLKITSLFWKGPNSSTSNNFQGNHVSCPKSSHAWKSVEVLSVKLPSHFWASDPNRKRDAKEKWQGGESLHSNKTYRLKPEC